MLKIALKSRSLQPSWGKNKEYTSTPASFHYLIPAPLTTRQNFPQGGEAAPGLGGAAVLSFLTPLHKVTQSFFN